MRWISADSVTSRIYDPPSLNKYTYVRNDPVNLTDPSGNSPVEFHQAFTSLLATSFGLSSEDAANLVRGAVDADDFVHGSTGLFLIGGWLINSPRHFGPPEGFQNDWYEYGLNGIHTIEDTSSGAPHDFGQGNGYLSSLWAALLHGLQGNEPDMNVDKIVAGARNAWASFNQLFNTDLEFPEAQVTGMATDIVNHIRAAQSQPGFYDDPVVVGIMAQYSLPGAMNGGGEGRRAEDLYNYQHGFGRSDTRFADPWAAFNMPCLICP